MEDKSSSWSQALKIGLFAVSVVAAGVAIVSNIDKVEKAKEEVKGFIQRLKQPKSEAKVEVTATKRELDAFYCPISHEIMKDPVITPYGHCYERIHIERWLEKSQLCPLTSNPLKKSDLIPCYSLRSAIEEYNKTTANNN